MYTHGGWRCSLMCAVHVPAIILVIAIHKMILSWMMTVLRLEKNCKCVLENLTLVSVIYNDQRKSTQIPKRL